MFGTKKTETRGRKPKLKMSIEVAPVINFDKVKPLEELHVDPRMMETMVSESILNQIVAYECGLPCATNLMFGGDPGVGKTTILLDYVSGFTDKKTLFISAEMGRKQMKKYTQRFKQFETINTLFAMDYLDDNFKDVIEQVLTQGYDIVLIDSIAEVLASVRDDNDWDKKKAEKWFIKLCMKNNVGINETNSYTTFVCIQQLNNSNGEFVGGNKLQYLFDGACKILREKNGKKLTGRTYIEFIKNRNGEVNQRLFYKLTNNEINYEGIESNEDAETEVENNKKEVKETKADRFIRINNL